MSKATNGSSNAKWTSLVIQHGLTTDVSNFTAVSGATGTTEATATSSQFVLPVHNDVAESGVIRFDINMVGKARHLRVVKRAPPSHHTSSNTVTLFRGNSSPDSAADAGLDAIVHL
ncbi:MAG: hypothetical protein IID34_01120 [Planctomycetes bacterium]|nr:hypothetical protein [Planctomycetota bacterium]